MKSIQRILGAVALLAVGVSATVVFGKDARSDETITGKGTAGVYGHVNPDSIEFLSNEEQINAAVSSNSPSLIWEVLEHAEKFECTSCIASVAPLLYSNNSEVREISAWWLRRRVFGVFGEGEVYQQTLQTLKNDSNASRRAYAAYALGEFLVTPGIAACAEAVKTDSDPAVRAAAASALGRLNDDGAGALSAAVVDSDVRVKLAGLKAVSRINKFTDVPALVQTLADSDAKVRNSGVQTLEQVLAKDSSASVIAIAKTDPDASVRASAAHALGIFHDPAARPALEALSASDPNGFVRDAAAIALRRL